MCVCRLPEAHILEGVPREGLISADGSPLNTCTSEALVEMLQFLKRAFWPFPWDTSIDQGSGGGFAGAAQVSMHICSTLFPGIDCPRLQLVCSFLL